MLLRKQKEPDNRGKSGPHARVRGNPVDAPLPKLKATEEKIPMRAIDPAWLEAHPESNRPTRIQDWWPVGEGDSDSGDEETSDMDG